MWVRSIYTLPTLFFSAFLKLSTDCPISKNFPLGIWVQCEKWKLVAYPFSFHLRSIHNITAGYGVKNFTFLLYAFQFLLILYLLISRSFSRNFNFQVPGSYNKVFKTPSYRVYSGLHWRMGITKTILLCSVVAWLVSGYCLSS